MGKLENKQRLTGHGTAILTILIWSTTFVSTKVLLREFVPVEILFFRFLMGLAALAAVYPRRLKLTDPRQEITFIGAGFCGVCLYYLLENVALTYTMASNVGVLLSVAPFFTAILTHLFMRGEEKLKVSFFVGFAVAMAGIGLISFNGNELHLDPKGDLLAVAAALVWAFYSILTKKISSYGYNTIQTTRRTFFYGLILMIPVLFLFDFRWGFERFAQPVTLFNLLFLGLGASALCFVTWNFAVKTLGVVKTSVYIYVGPVITVITSVIILHEPITPLAVGGIALTLAGLLISEGKNPLKMLRKREMEDEQ